MIEAHLSPEWNLKEIKMKYPVDYKNGMNLLLQHEISYYNKITQLIKEGIDTVRKTLLGEITMNRRTLEICESLIEGFIPCHWQKNRVNKF